MKFKSRKPRPVTDMDLSVTFSLRAHPSVTQCGEALVKFLNGVRAISDEIGAAWVHIKADVPEEFRTAVQAGLDKMKNPAGLKIVVNNDSSCADGEKR